MASKKKTDTKITDAAAETLEEKTSDAPVANSENEGDSLYKNIATQVYLSMQKNNKTSFEIYKRLDQTEKGYMSVLADMTRKGILTEETLKSIVTQYERSGAAKKFVVETITRYSNKNAAYFARLANLMENQTHKQPGELTEAGVPLETMIVAETQLYHQVIAPEVKGLQDARDYALETSKEVKELQEIAQMTGASASQYQN